MSSTHDAYIPALASTTRKILERALEAGVRICLQTRSPLAIKDFPLLSEYKDQVRVQVSIATMNHELSRIIEPRVAPADARFNILSKAKDVGLTTGIIIAPIMPSLKIRPSPSDDIEQIAERVSTLKPENIYGECLHTRGSNTTELESMLGEKIELGNFDSVMEKNFHSTLNRYGLKGRWWKEHKKIN